MKISVNKWGLLAYAAVLAGSIVFASFYGGPVSYVWLYGLLLFIPISLIYIFLNFKFLSLYQEIEVHKVVKAETHNFRAFIENEGILPIHRMKLGLYSDRCTLFEIKEDREVSLDIRGKEELFSGISCRYAGSYDVGIDTVSFSDPFRLFEITFKIPYTFRAIVSPRITDIANKSLDLENMVNSTGFKSADMVEDIPGSDMRAYQPGDSLSSINWKISARLSQLTVRVPDSMEKRTVTILMEASNTPEKDRDIEFLKRRDFFLEFAVSAAWHFGQQRVPVKLIYPSGDMKEAVVDSYDSFMEFYNIAADGIFYSSDEEYLKFKKFVKERSIANGMDTCILIREEPGPLEDHCTIIG